MLQELQLWSDRTQYHNICSSKLCGLNMNEFIVKLQKISITMSLTICDNYRSVYVSIDFPNCK
jgi:hypothetical protein